MPPPIDPETVCRLIAGHRFHFTDERVLQDGIAAVLAGAGYFSLREHVLGPRRRIDFWIPNAVGAAAGGLGIEVKIKGSPSAVLEQLIAYAQFPAIDALIVVTARMRLGHVPDTMNGKPIYTIPLWANGL